MAKHTFNATPEVEDILLIVEQALRDKTEFINRVIALHGRATVADIMRERQTAVDQALREFGPPYKTGKDTTLIKRKAQPA